MHSFSLHKIPSTRIIQVKLIRLERVNFNQIKKHQKMNKQINSFATF